MLTGQPFNYDYFLKETKMKRMTVFERAFRFGGHLINYVIPRTKLESRLGT